MAPATPILLRRSRALRPPEPRLLSLVVNRLLASCRALAAGASLAAAALPEPVAAAMLIWNSRNGMQALLEDSSVDLSSLLSGSWRHNPDKHAAPACSNIAITVCAAGVSPVDEVLSLQSENLRLNLPFGFSVSVDPCQSKSESVEWSCFVPCKAYQANNPSAA